MVSEGYRKKLTEYLKKNLRKGYTEESLKWALVQQGYSRTDVQMAIEQARNEEAKESPEVQEKPKIKHELYDKDNKLIKIEERHDFSLKKFLRTLFS
jgi:SOS response regulatory protein OraA/RecX